jgi:hypothetical protein
MESVDYCPMGNLLLKTFGGKLKQASVERRGPVEGILLLRGLYHTL